MWRRMKRSPLTPRTALGLLFTLCYCAAVFTAAAQEIRFRFDPPENFAYISTATHKHKQAEKYKKHYWDNKYYFQLYMQKTQGSGSQHFTWDSIR